MTDTTTATGLRACCNTIMRRGQPWNAVTVVLPVSHRPDSQESLSLLEIQLRETGVICPNHAVRLACLPLASLEAEEFTALSRQHRVTRNASRSTIDRAGPSRR